jgi:trehalose 6-phosphate phosphatase
VYESHSQRDNAANLVERVCDLLGSGRAGLVTDVDGTISPIVARPSEAQVLDRARDALSGLRDLLAVVAVVSGRTVADAQAMVGVEGLTYVGNHGLEVWSRERGAEVVNEARPWVPRLAAVLDDLRRQLDETHLDEVHNGPVHASDGAERAGTSIEGRASSTQNESRSIDNKGRLIDNEGTLIERRGGLIDSAGILIENKGASGSLHYRLAADPERARRVLLEHLARRAVTSGLRIEEGRMVINLLPPLTVTKGSAVTWLVREQRLERLVYLGDDVTDAHAFRALAALRQRGEAQTLSIGVVGSETPPTIRQLADASVPSVEAVADLLAAVHERLQLRAAERGARAAAVEGC